MFYIVESEEQLSFLANKIAKGAFIEVISSNDNFHPKLATTVAVYLRPLQEDKGYIIPIQHTDGLNVEKIRVEQLLSRSEVLYSYNKKDTLYHFFHCNIVDINLLYSLKEYDSLSLPANPSTIGWYYSRMEDLEDINSIIPLVKLYERCETNSEYLIPIIKDYQDMLLDPSWNFYNKTALGVYYLLEQSGLRVTYESFVRLFTPKTPRFSIQDNTVHGVYNPYNITSRPTNSFNSINLAAIPKKEEYRRSIIAKNNTFVEFDFDGYHVRLLADIVGYKFTEESVHTQLGRLYYDRDAHESLTEEEYKQSKQITFQILYGGVPDKWRHIEFFDKVHELTQKLWKEFKQNGLVRAPISQKPFTNKLKDMNSNKLMNYILQSVETSRNILILKEVLGYLKDKETQAVLYTYDSILIDFSKSDGKQTLTDLENILSKDGYPVKCKASSNLVLE